MRDLIYILAVVVFLASCTSQDKAKKGDPSSAGGEDVWQPPELPPLPATPNPLPAWASTQPPFPYLPGEDSVRSRSIGTTNDGWLVNAVPIPQPHDHLRRIDSHVDRELDYATQEMMDLVEFAANHVSAAYPGSVLYLGNFSADGGGDIPFSFSHNSGRDGDLAFYMLDASGNPAEPDDLLSFDSKGAARGKDGATYKFDVARNWKLVEGLVKSDAAEIQYVFVSRPLRNMLLAEARRVKSDATTIELAEAILTQPGGALPHDDHFHIRLFCSAADVASGCINGGRKHDRFDPHDDARDATIRKAEKLLSDDDPDVRLAAVRRLGLLSSAGSAKAIAKRLSDQDPRVRSSAGRVLAELKRDEGSVIAQLEREEDPNVRAELVWALGDYGSKRATEALTTLLETPQPAAFEHGATIDLRVLVADVLSVAEDERPVPALIDLTSSDDQEIRFRANRALKMLTNHDPAAKPKASLHDAWRVWWNAHGKKKRDAWLLAGFRAFGVKKLSLRYVWELTYPILEDDHLSYNAQRVLMRLAKRDAPSLEWGKGDANFYWRRWFERRCPRLGCPTVPRELTTLD